jgi:hypothetical protein
MATQGRIAYIANDSYAERMNGVIYYHLVEITEGQPGWRSACSCVDLEVLQAQAAARNIANGLTEGDVLDITASSMAVSRIC